jgi:hypothetical protein
MVLSWSVSLVPPERRQTGHTRGVVGTWSLVSDGKERRKNVAGERCGRFVRTPSIHNPREQKEEEKEDKKESAEAENLEWNMMLRAAYVVKGGTSTCGDRWGCRHRKESEGNWVQDISVLALPAIVATVVKRSARQVDEVRCFRSRRGSYHGGQKRIYV